MNLFLAQVAAYQSSNNDASGVAAMFMFVLTFVCISQAILTAVWAVIAWLVSDSLSKVPAEFRPDMSPGHVWLMLIPLFNLVWGFFVFQRVPDAFRAYFEATGRPQPGDYGKQLGLFFAISWCCCAVPCLNYVALPAALVLIIILIVKFVGFKNLIESGGGMGFPVQPPPPRQ